MLYSLMKHVIVGPALKTLYTPHVEGIEHIPEDGPAILASNHLSFSDSFFLPLVVDRKITFLAKSDYFDGPRGQGLDDQAVLLRRRSGARRPLRGPGEHGGASTPACGSCGRATCWASTRRAPAPRTAGSTAGAPAWRAWRWRHRRPVIPVAMIGTDKIQPTGQKIPNLYPLTIRIGKPLDFSRYDGMEDDRFVLRSMTDEIMYELMELSGQEYVDIYANKAKDLIAQVRHLHPVAGPRRRGGRRRGHAGLRPALGRCASAAAPSPSTARPRSASSRCAAGSWGCGSNRASAAALSCAPTSSVEAQTPVAEAGDERRAEAGGLQLGRPQRPARRSWSACTWHRKPLAAAPPSTDSDGQRDTGLPGHQVHDVAHLEGDGLERRAHDVRPGGAAGDADDRAARVRVPVRGAEAR